MNLNLNLSLEETNVVLSALVKQPYEVVAALVNKIQEQAKPQLNNEKVNENQVNEVEE